MSLLANLTDEDLDNLVQDIEAISQKDEREIYRIIGSSLDREGYEVSDSKGFELIEPKMTNIGNKKANLMSTFNFISEGSLVDSEEAESKGKRFWDRFKEKVKHVICNTPSIRDLITGNGTLKQYLVAGIPIILAALGIAALSPVMLVVVASAFGLIIKIGFEAYCEIA